MSAHNLTPEHDKRAVTPDEKMHPEVIASYDYVRKVVPTACGTYDMGWCWHGWSMREAFLAGCSHASAASAPRSTPRRTMELTDEEIMDAMPRQLHEDLAEVCRLASDSIGVKVGGMLRACLNRGIVDHCRTAIAADREADLAAELTDAQLLDMARGTHPWATWLASGGCLECAHSELAALMRAAIAADRAANTPSPSSNETR